MEISHRDAEKIVRDNERLREKFIEQCLHTSVSDLSHYNAVFNNARRGVAEIARTIVAHVAASWPDKRYFKSAAIV
jgi:hypothetical protein